MPIMPEPVQRCPLCHKRPRVKTQTEPEALTKFSLGCCKIITYSDDKESVIRRWNHCVINSFLQNIDHQRAVHDTVTRTIIMGICSQLHCGAVQSVGIADAVMELLEKRGYVANIQDTNTLRNGKRV